jgi:exodeoxyribonuclease III
MKLVTWNVNSLNVRLPHVLAWLQEHQPDALCLQELKLEDIKFPVAALEEIGYQAVFDGQKTYNGVAILTRGRAEDVQKGMPKHPDEQKRVVAATVNGVRVVSAYVPNGQALDSEKYQYKLNWLKGFHAYLEQTVREYGDVAVLGDYNIAPEDRDVHDPKAWEGQVLCSAAEREAFNRLLGIGFSDSFRQFEQPDKSFTWWDYRMNGFKRNLGLRIDHVLLTPNLATGCKSVTIDLAPRRLERPSDHTPVVADIG